VKIITTSRRKCQALAGFENRTARCFSNQLFAYFYDLNWLVLPWLTSGESIGGDALYQVAPAHLGHPFC
jgi:hypothetical protein